MQANAHPVNDNVWTAEAAATPRVFSVAVWAVSKCPRLWHLGKSHSVHSLLSSGQKLLGNLACEARSATCMLSYLVNACDVLLTASVLGFHGEDRADAAKWVLAAVNSTPGGVFLHGAQTLYMHCGNVFVARMRTPNRLMSRDMVVADMAAAVAGQQHWLQNKNLNRFPMLLLGCEWELPTTTACAPWPTFSSLHFSVIAGPGQTASVGVQW